MRFTKTIASASVAAVLGLAGVSVAGATANTGSSQPAAASATAPAGATGAKAGAAAKPAARKAMRRRRLRQAGKLAAQTIRITPADLLKELRAGKTIAEIATEHGVQPQAVITTLENAATAKITAARAADKITAERAAKLTTRFNRLIPKLVNNWHLRKAKAATA